MLEKAEVEVLNSGEQGVVHGQAIRRKFIQAMTRRTLRDETLRYARSLDKSLGKISVYIVVNLLQCFYNVYSSSNNYLIKNNQQTYHEYFIATIKCCFALR